MTQLFATIGPRATLDSASTLSYEGNSVVSLTLTDKTPYDPVNAKNDCNNDGDYLEASDCFEELFFDHAVAFREAMCDVLHGKNDCILIRYAGDDCGLVMDGVSWFGLLVWGRRYVRLDGRSFGAHLTGRVKGRNVVSDCRFDRTLILVSHRQVH